MKRNRFAIGILALFLLVGGLYSQDQSGRLYDEGRALLDGSHWAEAIEKFDQAAKQGGSRADAALYMKAFAQDKQGLRTETLATIQELQRSFPESRYINDAKALELRVRQEAGLPVEPDQQNCLGPPSQARSTPAAKRASPWSRYLTSPVSA
jgi:outer membrane protein assembly factor BamD (BamD/ComL family)